MEPCFVYVDVPNVVMGIQHAFPRSTQKYFKVDWKKLSQVIAELIPGMKKKNFQSAKAFGKDPKVFETQRRKENAERYRSEMRAAGFEVCTQQDKDVDSFIVNAMWKDIYTLCAFNSFLGRLVSRRLPKKVHFFLVSGDGGYLTVVKDIQKTFPSMKIVLHVITWKAGMSQVYKKHGVPIRYLDNVLGIVKP